MVEDVVFIMATVRWVDSVVRAVKSIVENAGITRGVLINNHGNLEVNKRLSDYVDRGLTIINVDRNLGHAVSFRLALDYALLLWPSAKYVLRCDDDIEAVGPIERMVTILEKEPRFAFCGPLLSSCWDAESKQRATGPGSRRDRFSYAHWLQVSAALIRIGAVEKHGFLDPRFGIYGIEDNDWILTLRKRGMGLVLDHGTFFYHHQVPRELAEAVDHGRQDPMIINRHGSDWVKQLTRCLPGCFCSEYMT